VLLSEVACGQQPELPALPLWDKSISLRGSAGYKDNVLLGNVTPRASAFVAGGVDFMVFRMPTGNTEFMAFVTGDDRRYFSVPEVDKERTLIAQAQVKQALGEDWKASFSLQYVFQDQVFDVSSIESGFSSLKMEGHAITARPAIRRFFGPRAYLEAEWTFTRQYFPSPIGNYWEGGPRLTLGYAYGHSSELAVSALLNERFYGQRTQTSLNADPITNSSLVVLEPGAEIAWDHFWDPKKRWRTTTKLSYRGSFDNGPGFYDFHKFRAAERVRFRAGPWQLSGEAKIERYGYLLQSVSDSDPSKKYLLGLGFELRGERKLSKSVKVYADYEYDRLTSNQTGNDYAVNTVSAGVEWEF
jgi:hypothetical protein